MKKVYFVLFSIVFSSVLAQKTITKEFTLSNGEIKNIKIFIPKNYESDTIHKCPVTLVLSDKYLFDLTKGNAKLFADSDLAPQQIVVGIPTDLSENKDISFVKEKLILTTNSAVFYDFIKKDLISYIKTNYRASPFFSIVAEREAAFFSTFFLRENTLLFNAYVLINPNLNEQRNKRIADYKLERLDDVDNTYFLYISQSKFEEQENTKAFNNLKTGLSSYDNKHLELSFENFENSINSVSMISESIPRAFSFIFKTYRSISKQEYSEKIKDLEPLDAIKYLEKRYIDINYLFGTNLNVRLNDFYAIEGIVMDKMDGDYLRVLGDFALIKHPESSLGDYYMGRFYEIGKDYKQASIYYKAGYGKMDLSDPKTDAFYKNIDRVERLMETVPQEDKIIPLDDEETDEEDVDDENTDDENVDDEKKTKKKKKDDEEEDKEDDY